MFMRKEDFRKKDMSFENNQGVLFKDGDEIFIAMLVNTNDPENPKKIVAVSAEGISDKVYIFNASDYEDWNGYVGDDEYFIKMLGKDSLRLDVTEL